MAEAKPMSAAEYAAHAESVDSQQRPTIIKTLKSGAVFELRKPDLGRMVILGLIPHSLLDEGVKSWEASGIHTATGGAPSISSSTVKEGLIVMREVVQEACVMPPFNELTAKSFLRQDFDEIYHWAMGHEGVKAVAGLRRFRKGRKRRTPADGPGSTELRAESVSTAEN